MSCSASKSLASEADQCRSSAALISRSPISISRSHVRLRGQWGCLRRPRIARQLKPQAALQPTRGTLARGREDALRTQIHFGQLDIMVGEPELAQLARQRKTLEPMPSNAGVMGDMLGGATRLGRVLINWTCW